MRVRQSRTKAIGRERPDRAHRTPLSARIATLVLHSHTTDPPQARSRRRERTTMHPGRVITVDHTPREVCFQKGPPTAGVFRVHEAGIVDRRLPRSGGPSWRMLPLIASGHFCVISDRQFCHSNRHHFFPRPAAGTSRAASSPRNRISPHLAAYGRLLVQFAWAIHCMGRMAI
jgi:hypothetical protein